MQSKVRRGQSLGRAGREGQSRVGSAGQGEKGEAGQGAARKGRAAQGKCAHGKEGQIRVIKHKAVQDRARSKAWVEQSESRSGG